MNHGKRIYIQYFLINTLASLPLLVSTTGVNAQDFTASSVRDKMTADEQIVYISGVVEGLAYARYSNDNKNTDGMKCIYDWFYQKDGTLVKIQSAFDNFKDYLPGAVIAAMVAKECG